MTPCPPEVAEAYAAEGRECIAMHETVDLSPLVAHCYAEPRPEYNVADIIGMVGIVGVIWLFLWFIFKTVMD